MFKIWTDAHRLIFIQYTDTVLKISNISGFANSEFDLDCKYAEIKRHHLPITYFVHCQESIFSVICGDSYLHIIYEQCLQS